MEYVANFTIQSSIATAVLLYLCTWNDPADLIKKKPDADFGPIAPFAIDAVYKVL